MDIDVPDELTNNEICLICHDPLEGSQGWVARGYQIFSEQLSIDIN